MNRASAASTFDVVIVGSGINSLVCAALLARQGRRVCVLERNDVPGGCIRTEELTQPGFRHDTLSTLYPLFVSAPYFSSLKDELARNGATFLDCRMPTAVLLSDGRSLVYRANRDANVAAFESLGPGDGAALRRAMEEIEREAELLFGFLGGELWRAPTARILLRRAWRKGLRDAVSYGAQALGTCRDWLMRDFRSELSRALLAPWVLHVGLGPESATSGLMAKLVMFTLEQAGGPMVKGGSRCLVDAFIAMIESAGGAVVTGSDVDKVVVEDGVACGVTTAAGREYRARRAVVCNVTPTQLYTRLLANEVPEDVLRRARAFRYGRGEMQIHLALSEPPQWPHPDLGSVAMLHLTSGLDAVSRAVNEAERGLLPHEATIVVAQPVAVDPTRAPPGRSILWIQLQELPSRVRGDAAEKISCPADGGWTDDLRERYADRIVERLCSQIPNLRRSIVGRAVVSPADLERLNINLVGGDPYSGSCALDQFGPWRPFAGVRDHETVVKRLFHIGASTHPGPGLGGMSGFMVAGRLG
jgi:phytoene dehydrogenase-like protein